MICARPRATTLLLTTFLALAIVSCSREDPEDILSDRADLVSFVLSKAENPSLSADLQGIRHRNLFYMTVPEGVDLTSLKPSLTVSPGAAVRIYNVPVTSSGSNPTASDSSSDPLASSVSNPLPSNSRSDPPATRSMPAVDFSKVVTVEVTAENGKTLQYKLLVKNGRQEFDNLIYQFMPNTISRGFPLPSQKTKRLPTAAGWVLP